MDRNEAITRIRSALRQRSGKDWSVTGGRGTAWGWIGIDAPPRRRTWTWDRNEQRMRTETDTGKPGGHTGPGDRAELAKLLGLEDIHSQGLSIPAGEDYYTEYVDRAEGRPPSKIGKPYWD